MVLMMILFVRCLLLLETNIKRVKNLVWQLDHGAVYRRRLYLNNHKDYIMRILPVIVSDFEQNSRILICEETKKAAVIDPGGGVEELIGIIRDEGVVVTAVLITHAHLDHAGGVSRLLPLLEEIQAARPKLYAHKDEQLMRASLSGQAQMFGLASNEYQDCPEPDQYLQDGEEILVGNIKIKALYTPGHSPGHLAFFIEDKKPVVITGDALFKGSIGRTDLPGGNYRVLIKSIENKLLTLPDKTIVMPGHGPDTTIFNEKNRNPFLTAVEKI